MRCVGENHTEAGAEAHNCITEEISGRVVLAINCSCYGCIAFAGEVSDKVFGKNAKVTTHKDFDKIKVGDHIRIGGYHSVIVWKKTKDSVTVVEGNYNSSVHWGREITRSELKAEGFYVDSRY